MNIVRTKLKHVKYKILSVHNRTPYAVWIQFKLKHLCTSYKLLLALACSAKCRVKKKKKRLFAKVLSRRNTDSGDGTQVACISPKSGYNNAVLHSKYSHYNNC